VAGHVSLDQANTPTGAPASTAIRVPGIWPRMPFLAQKRCSGPCF